MEETERIVGSYPLTPEMNNFIDAVTAGLDVKGEAYAGTGKSSTLRAVEKYHKGKKGLYICFNKTLEQDARRLFKGNTVDIATAHSFALNSFSPTAKKHFLSRVNEKLYLKHYEQFGQLDTSHPFCEKLNLKTKYSVLTGVIEHYFSTASIEITEKHFTKQLKSYMIALEEKGVIKASELRDIAKFILNICNMMAKAMLDEKSKCPTTHDGYLKSWQLSNPVIDYDYIMFDECQDASPVLLSVILKQKCQRIFVGDRFQAIYQFRGSVNAMDIIPFETFPLSQSFRYGQGIADIANQILNHYDEDIRIRGNGTDSVIISASEFGNNPNKVEPFLFIAHSNQSLLETLAQCYEAGVPARFCTNKVDHTINSLKSLFALHETGKAKLSLHSAFNSLKELSEQIKQAESKYLANLILEDEQKANTLLAALEWSRPTTESDADVHLVTAHSSKGLEFDTVMISDDFYEAINAFGGGKPMSDNELYLLYVAVTRAKKTLVLADELYDALKNPLAFTLNKTKPEPCLLDNLEVIERVHTEQPGQQPEAKPEPNTSSLESSTTEESLTSEPEVDEKPKPKTKKKTEDVCNQQSDEDSLDNNSIKVEVGRCKETDAPLYWLPTDTNHFFNPNLAVLGTMGTGKTQTNKSILLQLNRQRKLNTNGEKFGILVLDYKDDYVDDEFVNATGAIVLEANNIPINPLAIFDKKNKLAPVHTAKTFISTLGRVYGLGPKQNQLLKNCIDLAYERKGIYRNKVSTFSNPAPTLRDVYAIYNSQEKVASDKLMSALSDLYDYEIFEPNARKCKSLAQMLEGNIVVMKLSGTDENLQSLIVALLLDIFYIQMHQGGKPQPSASGHRALKNLVLCDEADNFMRMDFPSLRKVLKEGREFGTGVILSTQGIDHFNTAENNYIDYQNAFICHRLNSPKKAQVEAILALDDKSLAAQYHAQVGQLDKHHALFINGKKEITHQESTAFWKVVQQQQ